METLTIINIVINSLILAYIFHRENRMYITANKTFWCHRTFSYTVMWNTKPLRRGISARGLFTISIRDYDKSQKWDDEMYQSGKHKKYRKQNN